MQACGLGTCARQALIEIERIRSMDVIVLVRNGNEMHIRLVSKPDDLAAELLRKMGLKLPTRPKIVECSGVPSDATPCQNGSKKPQSRTNTQHMLANCGKRAKTLNVVIGDPCLVEPGSN